MPPPRRDGACREARRCVRAAPRSATAPPAAPRARARARRPMASWCGRWPSPCDSKRALIRCVYTDLDGTLLGRGASLFRDADGAFTLLAARALEACFRAGAQVVLKSGRRKAQVM